MTSVLISGATGFVGTHLLAALPDVEKICLVRSDKSIPDCETWRLDNTIPQRTVDVFIHCAASVNPDNGAHNLELTKRMLVIAKACNVKHFIFISSYVVETTTETSYLLAKREEEALVKASGIPFTIFRPTAIFGPGDKATLGKLHDAVQRGKLIPLPNKGVALMQPIFVKDLANLIAQSLLNKKALNKTYTVGGTQTSMAQMVALLCELQKKKQRTIAVPVSLLQFVVNVLHLCRMSPLHPKQVRNLAKDFPVDISPLQKDFGFVPTPFEQALQETYK
ncbi:NAD-dependent epimerase/dehydratase family protein [Candidatus Woesearchaeota archaeon]|nr:NAD-dependent epimerase/dehydratase family protein [Candidatus Woesearchaeota archaeon]